MRSRVQIEISAVEYQIEIVNMKELITENN